MALHTELTSLPVKTTNGDYIRVLSFFQHRGAVFAVYNPPVRQVSFFTTDIYSDAVKTGVIVVFVTMQDFVKLGLIYFLCVADMIRNDSLAPAAPRRTFP